MYPPSVAASSANHAIWLLPITVEGSHHFALRAKQASFAMVAADCYHALPQRACSHEAVLANDVTDGTLEAEGEDLDGEAAEAPAW